MCGFLRACPARVKAFPFVVRFHECLPGLPGSGDSASIRKHLSPYSLPGVPGFKAPKSACKPRHCSGDIASIRKHLSPYSPPGVPGFKAPKSACKPRHCSGDNASIRRFLSPYSLPGVPGFKAPKSACKPTIGRVTRLPFEGACGRIRRRACPASRR